jgi:hypothetical protein
MVAPLSFATLASVKVRVRGRVQRSRPLARRTSKVGGRELHTNLRCVHRRLAVAEIPARANSPGEKGSIANKLELVE